MNAAVYDPLRARIQALEQEIALLRQGVQQATRMRRLWELAIKDLQSTRQQLEFSNTQLSILHRLGVAIDQRVDLQQLVEKIMDVMEQVPGVGQGRPMGIFLAEDTGMRLVASRGADEGFVSVCGDTCRDCLGHFAGDAGKGMLCPVCVNASAQDAVVWPAEPRGHIIVPLTSRGRTIGAFCCFPPTDGEFDAVLGETFMAIGRQIGMAIEQARLAGI